MTPDRASTAGLAPTVARCGPHIREAPRSTASTLRLAFGNSQVTVTRKLPMRRRFEPRAARVVPAAVPRHDARRRPGMVRARRCLAPSRQGTPAPSRRGCCPADEHGRKPEGAHARRYRAGRRHPAMSPACACTGCVPAWPRKAMAAHCWLSRSTCRDRPGRSSSTSGSLAQAPWPARSSNPSGRELLEGQYLLAQPAPMACRNPRK